MASDSDRQIRVPLASVRSGLRSVGPQQVLEIRQDPKGAPAAGADHDPDTPAATSTDV